MAAGQLLAAALTASLPGIDANDPPKSLACFRLYCIVLCSIGPLQARAGSHLRAKERSAPPGPS